VAFSRLLQPSARFGAYALRIWAFKAVNRSLRPDWSRRFSFAVENGPLCRKTSGSPRGPSSSCKKALPTLSRPRLRSRALQCFWSEAFNRDLVSPEAISRADDVVAAFEPEWLPFDHPHMGVVLERHHRTTPNPSFTGQGGVLLDGHGQRQARRSRSELLRRQLRRNGFSLVLVPQAG